MSTILEVEDLRTYFDTEDGEVRAVDGLSFSLNEGESLGIVGESGSGKSVTQLSIMGLIPQPPGRIVSGRALFHGDDLLQMSPSKLRKLRGRRISMIFQDPMTSLNPFLRISRQLTEVLETHTGASRARAEARAIEMLDKVGIPSARERFRQYPHQFSGGMRQRVMIAMALMCDPELLIADEPTTALDVTIQAQILELIGDLRRDAGTSVILITHDLGVVAGMAERVIVMYAGRAVEEAPANVLFEAPAHPYTMGLLRSIPRLDEGESTRLEPIEGLPPNLSSLPKGCPFHPRCPLVEDRCRVEFPEPREVAPGHRVSCWRPEAQEIHAAELRELRSETESDVLLAVSEKAAEAADASADMPAVADGGDASDDAADLVEDAQGADDADRSGAEDDADRSGAEDDTSEGETRVDEADEDE